MNKVQSKYDEGNFLNKGNEVNSTIMPSVQN